MGGIVDWEAIEDRLRRPVSVNSWNSIKEILNAASSQFRLNRMHTQLHYIEVWVEKDALSGVLQRVTDKYGIPIMVNRGYSSVSAMYDALKPEVLNSILQSAIEQYLDQSEFDAVLTEEIVQKDILEKFVNTI